MDATGGTTTAGDAAPLAASVLDTVRGLFKMDPVMLAAALLPIYTGAHAALSRPATAAEPEKRTKRRRATADGVEEEEVDDEFDEDDSEEECGLAALMKGGGTPKLQASDAVTLPLTAAAVLGVIYLVITSSGEALATLNMLLRYHVSLSGLWFLRTLFTDAGTVLRSFVFPSRYYAAGKHWAVDRCAHRFVSLDAERAVCDSPLPFPGPLRRLPRGGIATNLLWRLRDVAYCKLEVRCEVRRLLSLRETVRPLAVASWLAALAAVGYYLWVARPWYLSNLLGTASAYGALALMSPASFGIGSALLVSLFFYDIYMVFYTPLMVTVARNLDIPAKLLLPRRGQPCACGSSSPPPMAILGLGDIIIPGMMMALALKFDLHLFYLRKQQAQPQQSGAHAKPGQPERKKPRYIRATGGWGERFWGRWPADPSCDDEQAAARAFPKTYFHASVVGYVLAMMVCGYFLDKYDAAQPALLYLVPGVLGALWGTALARGEVKLMWNYSNDFTPELEPAKRARELKAGGKGEVKRKRSLGLFSTVFGTLWTMGTEFRQEAVEAEAEAEAEAAGTAKPKDKPTSRHLIRFSVSLPRTRRRTAGKIDRSSTTAVDSAAVHEATGHAPDGAGTLKYVCIENSPSVLAADEEASGVQARRTGKPSA
ncbi:hypothetical protein KEM52_001672 [Ascosphaera acerosa]|nr:hypothetical protein KEM52_001672 [Ascosphaera acerosa]